MNWNIDWRLAARHVTIDGDRILIDPVPRYGMQMQLVRAVTPGEEGASAGTALRLLVLLQLLSVDMRYAAAFERPHSAVEAALRGELGPAVAEDLRAVYNAQNRAVAPPPARLIRHVAAQVRTRDPARLFGTSTVARTPRMR